MTREEILDIEGTPTVTLMDGHVGMLLIYPDEQDGRCGIQVPGEDEHRWVHHEKLSRIAGSALVQIK